MRSLQRQLEFDKVYMKMAVDFASLSHAVRRKVGCLIVSSDDQIISQGFNGTPSGFDNCCEDEWCGRFNSKIADVDKSVTKCHGDLCISCVDRLLKTKREVLHAESNAITKCSKSHNSTIGSTIYITTSPCIDCAKLIIQAGVRRAVYLDEYHDLSGVELLRNAGIVCEQIEL